MSQEKTAPQNAPDTVDNSASEKNVAPRSTVRIRTWTEKEWFEIRPELMQALQVEYPNVDVRREVAKMVLWAESNESKPWVKPMSRIHKWLKKEAARQAKKGNTPSRGTRAARATKGVEPWFRTSAGWVAQGAEIGVVYEEGEPFVRFRARVCIAMGPGPWINERDWTLMNAIKELRGENQAAPVEQARRHIERLKAMGLYRQTLH